MTRPAPIPDPVTAPYWKAVSEGRLVLPRCERCRTFHFYPRGVCPHCGAEHIAWSPASGRGTLYSYSVVHRAPSPAFKEDVPYVIGIVATEEGPHLLSRVVGVAPEAVHIGMRLQVRFDKVSEDAALPVFEPEMDRV